ncbi:hypothetical protein [Mesorhizobium sp. B2-4-6]|uniref:hypothetical protein n=1 Tax=Mesorhizobium sp. B2-4-6 TaxID=2589943 RepID=UPI00112AF14C|nr:hypothetical protein [Mesorhizobium sp. B2-4-6]TPL40697.1 hypothetical protein FJ957_26055 [Mesorhizobium sp. B2-4-6]
MLRFENTSGIGRETGVVDTTTGEDIGKVLAISMGAQIVIGEFVTCHATLSMIEIDLAVDKTEFHTKNPVTGGYEPVAAIEFRDGTRVEIAEDGTPSVTTK